MKNCEKIEMIKTQLKVIPTIIFLFQSALWISCAPAKSSIQNARDISMAIYTGSFSQFKIIHEQSIPESQSITPVKINLEEGFCYRIIAVRNQGSGGNEISVSFKHSEQIVEIGSDFIELTENDGVKRKERVIWGFCVWPSLTGKLEIYTNLNETGGYLMVVRLEASKIGWKGGRDVKIYLKGMGKIDLKKIEYSEVEPVLKSVLSKDHMNLPEKLQGKKPAYHEITGITTDTWELPLEINSSNCYHILIASPNCLVKYAIKQKSENKVLFDDGAPAEIGRNGWIQDFCVESGQTIKDAVLIAKFKMISERFEHCWFAVAIYNYEASQKEIKSASRRVSSARKKPYETAQKCISTKTKCEKKCTLQKGKRSEFTSECVKNCFNEFDNCAGAINFYGELIIHTSN